MKFRLTLKILKDFSFVEMTKTNFSW